MTHAEAEARGRRGETVAALWLMVHGWRVLARRERTPVGEIDLIARRGRVVAFVEVKTREVTSEDSPVGARQQGRIARAAEAVLARRRDLDGLDVRFDLIVVRPWRLPRIVADAWRPPSRFP